jgi:serralysin
MATLHPTAHEQYLLELINRARANPLDEVTRNPDVVDLNEGLAMGTITPTAKQPLAFNLNLIAAARNHSQWMLDTDTFSHTGAGGSSAGKRMTDAGYGFTGAYTWGENIAWQGTNGTLNLDTTVAGLHNGLFESPGHRTNLMNGSFQEVGLGILTGDFSGYNAAMVTQNFAKSGDAAYLTGVVFNDAVLDDDFYTIGEAVPGVSIQAVRQADGQTVTTTNFDSGGYSLALDPGTYTVTFTGDSLVQPVSQTVTIGETNVKLDLATDLLGASFPPVAADQAMVDPGLPVPAVGAAAPATGPVPTEPLTLPDWLTQWFSDLGGNWVMLPSQAGL